MEVEAAEKADIQYPSMDSDGIFRDRTRTNLFRKSEQKLIAFVVQKMPHYVTSDMLTVLGLFGSIIVLVGFALGAYYHITYLLLGILGLTINWIGDSIDGRLAYYRRAPRKWYGFALDVITDWLGTVLIGLGYLIYAQGIAEILAFLFVCLYGWAIIISQIRYKITSRYEIDSGLVGPTELRVIISVILIVEVLFPGSVNYAAAIITLLLFIINIIDTRKLLHAGELRDAQDAQEKGAGSNL